MALHDHKEKANAALTKVINLPEKDFVVSCFIQQLQPLMAQCFPHTPLHFTQANTVTKCVHLSVSMAMA